MSKTTITIQTVTTPTTRRAIVRGEWAAHLALGMRHHWALTHVPSGAMLTQVLGRRAMIRSLRALAALPPCPATGWLCSGSRITGAGDAYRAWFAAAQEAVRS